MSKSRPTEAQLSGALKQLEARWKAEDVVREVGVSKPTIYAWKATYGRMDVSQAEEAKQLRDENTRFRKLVADLSLDKEALQSVIQKKRVELVVPKAAVEQVQQAYAFSQRRAYGLMTVGCQVTAIRRGGRMNRCARSWWSWRGRSRASAIDGCMRCCAAREKR